jgi:hypothetical protein
MSKERDALLAAIPSVATPDSWEPFVECLSDVLGGAAVTLGLGFRRASRIGPVAAAQITAEYRQSYVGRYRACDPWVPRLLERPGRSVVFGYEVVPTALLVRTEFYTGWMEPQGLLPTLTINALVAGVRTLSTLTVFRRRNTRNLEIEDLTLVRSILSQLQRAMERGA